MQKQCNQQRVKELMSAMTLQEKLGQLNQFSGDLGQITAPLAEHICMGRVGSIVNEVDALTVKELQRLAVEETRLGIPLLFARDVIHGFRTIFPIPLGQAASWSPQLIEKCARISALEAATTGINWTFAPMIDISRDPRWGRIAESLGEDPWLCSELGNAMVKGFQTEDLSQPGTLAACAKHFVGYGASESGRDYTTVTIPENELRNVHLPPFNALANEGVASFMTAFSDLNGIPASGNTWLTQQVLREEWQYQGVLVSDWFSIEQLSIHGFTENDKESAYEAFNATTDVEMASTIYQNELEDLIQQGRIQLSQLDQAVERILSLKFRLGLFEKPYAEPEKLPALVNEQHLAVAKEAALKSTVLLKNSEQLLPLSIKSLDSIAVIGPLADDGYEQLGTWIFDGQAEDSITCLQAIEQQVGSHCQIHHVKALETSRSRSSKGFQQAVQAASSSDVALLFLGEEAFLSGEAHCRAELDLPGSQNQLIEAIAETGTPLVAVILAGRPLTLESVLPNIDALLYAWHPGTMGGPAIADLLFGKANPSAKLPVTFPRKVGQIPIYYAQKNGCRPATKENYVHMDDIEIRAPQTSVGMAAMHLDTHFTPLFHFGFGLSYSKLNYQKLALASSTLTVGETLVVTAEIRNEGPYGCEEIVQLYIRDRVASVTRPVKELKGFQRVPLARGETQTVRFELHSDALAFYGRDMKPRVEPGQFDLWIGSSSEPELKTSFELLQRAT